MKRTIRSKNTYLILTGIIIAIVFYIFGSYVKIQNPIVVQFKPLFLWRATEIPKKTETPRINAIKRNSVDASKKIDTEIADIIGKIRIMESGNGSAKTGLSVYCSAKGMWNRVGYMPSKNFCFESGEDETEVLTKWFNDKFTSGFTVDEALCFYNTGERSPMCSYSIAFGKL